MAASEKIITIDNKIEQNKAHCCLGRQTSKIFALSPRNVGKYEFSISKEVLTEKGLLDKVAAIERLEHLPVGKELKKQIDIGKKQYQRLDKIYEFNKIGKRN